MQRENEETPQARTGRGLNQGDDNSRPLLFNASDKSRQVAILRALGHLYDIEFAGELIIRRSRDPECDLARALLARGLTGAVKILDGTTGKHRSTVNIEKAAKLTAEEGPNGPRFVRHRTVGDRAPTAETDLPLAPTPSEREAA